MAIRDTDDHIVNPHKMQPTTMEYYHVLPLPPQPESTTTVTDGAYGQCNRCGHAPCICDTTPLKRTPQKHRQYWSVMKAVIGEGRMIRTKRGLLRLMEDIEEWVG